MERRAFTLMELLIAMAVLLAIMSLVMPGVYSRLATSRGQEARRMIDASIIQARAAAARSGDAVRVYAHVRADGAIDIVHEPLRADDADDSFDEALEPFMVDGAEIAPDEMRAEERSSAAEINVTLPDGCRVMLMSVLRSYESLDTIDEDEQPVPEPDRTIAILLPNGDAMPGATLALVTPRQRAFEFSVRTWTGGVEFVPWDPEEEPADGGELP